MTTNNMQRMTLKQVREMFEHDSVARKANKSANAPIIKLINIIDNDNATIMCEYAKGGTILNRGSVVECLIKILFNHYTSTRKYGQGRGDMYHDGVGYEIKYSSSKGYASFSGAIDRMLIFVNQYGVYLTSGTNLVMDKCGKHIQSIKMNKSVKVLLEF